MLDKVVAVLVYTAVVLVAPLMLPYLLYRVWGKRIPFKKQGRGVDFDSSASKPAG